MITVEQIKAARGLLEWSQDDLADAAIISRPALNNLERRQVKPRLNTLTRIQKALERAGIEFIDGGVRYRKQVLNVQTFEGDTALLRLMQDIFETLSETGGENLIMGVSEAKFIEHGNERFLKAIEKFHRHNIFSKILVQEGDTHFIEPRESYRWISKELFSQVPHFVYGSKYAIILWGPPEKIIVIENEDIAESYRKQFYAHWNRAKIP
ncbi:MAG: helix-turn-helix domain-containing protein [Alphaproteobacteria bacterium]|nr:helix-turn-helix domain-containing protein [Alphaproteobacteria bacterium]